MANIRKRGETYQIVVSLGYDGNGKQVRKFMNYKPPAGLTEKQLQKELQKAAIQFEELCKSGQILDTSTRFRDFSERWLNDYAEKQLKARTVTRYKELLTRINAAFGNMKMQDIKPVHITSFYNNLSEKGVRADIKYRSLPLFAETLKEKGLTQQKTADGAGVSLAVVRSCVRSDNNVQKKSAEKLAAFLGLPLDALFTACEDKGLSGATVHRYHELLSSMFTTAVQWQVIFSNPCQRVKPPRIEQRDERYLDEVQAAELLKALENAPYQYAVMIKVLLYMGLRRGELCGLEWSDIDFLNNVMSINRNSLYTAERGVYTDTPKTKKSRRVIKMSDNVVKLLKEFRAYQQEKAEALGDKWVNSNRLFTKWNGEPIHPDSITNWFQEFVKDNSLPDISVHSLRHTNATLMIASGVQVRTVSSRLGHANTTTTQNIYAHAIRSADEAAAEALDDILTPKYNNKLKKFG